ncbi:hypothetical protein AK812_SmicGene37863 [Symbiodinium microadriaticum]|uniref:Uncharacterized protein n=1 Tax=Symbiodinium microadriaticum TaxID=2951 RepID=A0A1Q9CFF0_SYMMI|nr:hypothetical protein AK812_SmicGene37863 [Symbiodinium microadriaticum]
MDLQAVADAAGAESDVRRYLRMRGVTSAGTLATVIAPLLAGSGVGADRIELQEADRPIAAAVLLFMRKLAVDSHSASQPTGAPGPAATSATPGSTGAGTGAKDADKELVVDVDRDRLVAKDTEDSWEPRSMLAVIDALDALRWAYILLEYGHEFDVCALFDDFIHKARQRPQQLDAFRSYYESATWKLCRELRSGRTFAESVAAVREDLQLFQEVMSRPGPSSGKSSGANSVGSSETRGTSECPEPSWPHHRFLGTSSAAWSSGPHFIGVGFIIAFLGAGLIIAFQANSAECIIGRFAKVYDTLGFFLRSGLGHARTSRLGITVRHVLSWEIDEAAIAVARKSSRRTTKTQRGSLLADSPESAARAVEQVPGGAADLLVITAAAPCPDFSRIRSDSSPGRHGPSGNLFVQFTTFIRSLLNLLPGRRASLLVENVVMHNPADTQWSSQQLDAEAVLADAADYGAIHRPRLWLSWTDWTAVRTYPGGCAYPDVDALAEALSRECSIGASRHWHDFTSPMDALWPIFKRVATDLEYALEEAPRALLQLEWSSRMRRHVSDQFPPGRRRVGRNVALAAMNVDVPIHDGRRIEVVCNGLPLWHGAQLAVDATLVSPVSRDGRPHPGTETQPGFAVRTAARSLGIGSQWQSHGLQRQQAKGPSRIPLREAGASPMLRISVQHECQQFAADILVNDPTGKSSLPAHLPQLTASSEHSAVKEFCLPPPLQSWHDSTSATPALMLRTGLEAGARVARNVRLSDMSLDVPVADARRIEVVANVSPLTRLGDAHSRADADPGCLARARRCRLVVVGVEVLAVRFGRVLAVAMEHLDGELEMKVKTRPEIGNECKVLWPSICQYSQSVRAMPWSRCGCVVVPVLVWEIAASCLGEDCAKEETDLVQVSRPWKRSGWWARGKGYGYYGSKDNDDGDDGDDPSPSDPSDGVACTYSRTYKYPADEDQVANPDDTTEMISRCSSAGVAYVNTSEDATCIINSNGDGYDYGNVADTSACPYPAGATPWMSNAECLSNYTKWIAKGATEVTLADGTTAMTGIGHGVLDGVRGLCAIIYYEVTGKTVVIFQVDIRSWSLEMTLATWQYLTEITDAGNTCIIPTVTSINCTDVPFMTE